MSYGSRGKREITVGNLGIDSIRRGNRDII